MTHSYSFAAPSLRREPFFPAMARRFIPESPARRLLNVVIASLGILLTFPLMVLIAIAIRCTSPGPILFIQTRVGLDRRAYSRRRTPVVSEDLGGAPFRMYKFRTMHTAPADAVPAVWATPNDDRVFPLGRVLRKFRLDELPQLFNVLLGDMNVVGPRPEQPAIFARLRRQVLAYPARQRIRPGITGLAQVSQGYDRGIDDVRQKVAFDLDYLHRQSVGTDLGIMLRTIPVMIGHRLGW